jgi:hypothetical protein
VYGEADLQDAVLIVAVAARLANPGRELDEMFRGMAAGGLSVGGIQAVYPGPLGGEAKCGVASVTGLSIVMCGWADAGSIGTVGFYFEDTIADVTADFVRARGEIEKRG